MSHRTSVVDSIRVIAIIFGSIFEIGDMDSLHAQSNILAVQRERERFLGEEPPAFNLPPFKYETIIFPSIPVHTHFSNPTPFIKVGDLNVIAASVSSSLIIGHINDISLESQVRHIRHYKDKK